MFLLGCPQLASFENWRWLEQPKPQNSRAKPPTACCCPEQQLQPASGNIHDTNGIDFSFPSFGEYLLSYRQELRMGPAITGILPVFCSVQAPLSPLLRTKSTNLLRRQLAILRGGTLHFTWQTSVVHTMMSTMLASICWTTNIMIKLRPWRML